MDALWMSSQPMVSVAFFGHPMAAHEEREAINREGEPEKMDVDAVEARIFKLSI